MFTNIKASLLVLFASLALCTVPAAAQTIFDGQAAKLVPVTDGGNPEITNDGNTATIYVAGNNKRAGASLRPQAGSDKAVVIATTFVVGGNNSDVEVLAGVNGSDPVLIIETRAFLGSYTQRVAFVHPSARAYYMGQLLVNGANLPQLGLSDIGLEVNQYALGGGISTVRLRNQTSYYGYGIAEATVKVKSVTVAQ